MTWFSVVASIGIFFVSLFCNAQGTWIEKLVNWLHLSGIITFCTRYNSILISLFFVMFMYQWIKNWKILLSIFIAVTALIFFKIIPVVV